MKTLITFFAVAACAWAAESPDPVMEPAVQAIQRVMPSVVNINTERIVVRQYRDPFDEFFRQFFGQPQRPQPEGSQSLGSGVIVDEDGWIVSNYHVIQRASKINVVLSDGTQHQAVYVSGDEKNDLVLLKIDAKKPLPFVEIASDREALLGETVIAVGNPFGLEHTVTKGIISAKKRKYAAGDVVFNDILQTDAAINPGNSGGPLVDLQGKLVGINMAILQQAEGIGFAIPAKRVAGMLADWLLPEKRSQVWLGLRFGRDDKTGKIQITDVQADSPAAKAGLKTNEVVSIVDGSRYSDVLRLQRYLMHKKSGQTVQIEIEGAGTTRKVSVALVALPKVSVPELMAKKFGLQVQPLTPELAEAMGFGDLGGILVADVQAKSPASEAGFQQGMVITHIGGQQIESLDRLAELLASVKPGDAVGMAVFVREQRGNIMFQRTVGVTLKSR
jgi:S1-C subfamily serine protease